MEAELELPQGKAGQSYLSPTILGAEDVLDVGVGEGGCRLDAGNGHTGGILACGHCTFRKENGDARNWGNPPPAQTCMLPGAEPTLPLTQLEPPGGGRGLVEDCQWRLGSYQPV